MAPDVTVVVMTRDRGDELLGTLDRLLAPDPELSVVVVDNGSTDGTPDRVRRSFPQVDVVALPYNAGVAARNLGVERATTPYVAFNDDDSWWSPDSLARVGPLFDAHPDLAAVAARVVVEPAGTTDPTSVAMADSALVRVDPRGDLPGVPVLGFLACAVAVRRSAFLSVGGFEQRFHFGGEEQLLAADLAAHGWGVRYVGDLDVHHAASSRRDPAWRRRRDVRNALWFQWLRRPVPRAAAMSWRVLARASPLDALAGGGQALGGLPWVMRARRAVPRDLEARLRLLEGTPG